MAFLMHLIEMFMTLWDFLQLVAMAALAIWIAYKKTQMALN